MECSYEYKRKVLVVIVAIVIFVLFSAFFLTELDFWSNALDPIRLFVALSLAVGFSCIALTILDHFFPSLLH